MTRIAALLGLVLASSAFGREYETQIRFESLDELYALAESGDLDADSVEVLEALLNDPLDLNSADADRLYDLPGISRSVAEAIVRQRQQAGRYKSLNDLARVPGLSQTDTEALRPFVSVRPVGALADLQHEAVMAGLWRRGYGRPAEEVVPGPEGYLRWRSRLGDRWNGGGLVTYRPRVDAYFDAAWGHWVSSGAENRADLDAVYLAYQGDQWRAVMGSYNIGFGEGLVLNNTTRRAPHGWYASAVVREDSLDASVRPDKKLFGTAFQWRKVGPVDGHVFLSSQAHDAYQYDIRYEADEWLVPLLGECATPGQQSQGYTCGGDGVWYSTRILDLSAPDQSLAYLTFEDGFRETLGGINLTIHGRGDARVGFTGYISQLEFDPDLGRVHFAPAARYPDRDRLFAAGVFARRPFASGEMAGEYARTAGGGAALFGRLTGHPTDWLQLELALRSYDPDYQNPHGRGEAEPDEADGLRQRNERGVRVQVVLRPWRRWRFVSDVDLWENPYRDVAGDWIALEDPPKDLRLRQRISYSGRKESASLVGEYINKDIDQNAREQVYAGPDLQAAGERRKVSVSVSTTRLSQLRLGADVALAWEDVSAYATRFDREALARIRVSAFPWPQVEMHALIGRWFHDKKSTASVLVDRERPVLQSRLELLWSPVRRTRLSFRYSNLRYADERPERFALYHLVRVAVALEF